MSVSVYEQARALTAALAAGGGLGLLFDLLRPLRRQAGAFRRLLSDGLFLTLSGLWLLLTGRLAGMDLRFLCGAAAGICFYLWSSHPLMTEKLSKIGSFLHFRMKDPAK